MSGYHGYSKSNNAVAAEAEGLYPASVLAKRIGVRAAAIKALMRPTEWHHTSAWYNRTQYYSEDDALEIIEELRAWRPPDSQEIVHEGCTGWYLAWSGTRRFRRAREVQFGPIRVTQRGTWFTLHLPSGPLRKRADTRGFVLRDSAGKVLASGPS